MCSKKTSKRRPRAPRTGYWRRQVADPADAVAALNEAKARLTLAGIGGGTPAEILDKFTAEHAAAEHAVAECFEKVRFHHLPATQFEDLMSEHPPTPEDEEKGLVHHDATFVVALAAACCDNGWTLEDWVEEWAELSVGERNELREVVTLVNTRSWSSQIPKD